MKLYLLTQDENTGYDTYDSCVVCAENENEAKKIEPTNFFPRFGWTTPNKVKIKYLGEAAPNIEKGVVIASFNAG